MVVPAHVVSRRDCRSILKYPPLIFEMNVRNLGNNVMDLSALFTLEECESGRNDIVAG